MGVAPGSERTYAALLCTLDEVAGPDDIDGSAFVGRIDALCRAGVHVGIRSGRAVSDIDRRLQLRPEGSGTVHLLTDGGVNVYHCGPQGVRMRARGGQAGGPAPAGVRWLLQMLDDRGIGPGLVLLFGPALAAVARAVPALHRAAIVAGAPTGDGGRADASAALAALIDGQLRRRAEHRVPDLDRDPAWVLRFPAPDHPADVAVQETLCTLSDGRVGTRGSLEERSADAPVVFAAGVYTDVDDRRTLLPGPSWTALPGLAAQDGNRLLDLRTGVLLRESSGGFRSVRFASSVRPGVMAMRAEADGDLAGGPPLGPCDEGSPDMCRSTACSTRGGGIVAVACQTAHAGVERIVGYAVHPSRVPGPTAAQRVVDDARRIGFDDLLAEHREGWARRWADAAVTIEGDADAQLAVRFGLFHLLSLAQESGETAVGARGTSGTAYDGHVFWDADVFVLPVLAAVRPAAARSMLQYRVNRVAGARRRASDLGYEGALWPWESTDDGDDVTPATGRDRNGRIVPIRTGGAEQHVVADVAWAAVHYARWTGDDGFLTGEGLPLVVEGARFWASRVEHDEDGSAHIRAVIGPDEYHELVDDNAFTNVMARWHLRAAADLAERCGVAAPHEIAAWRRIADALVDGYDAATGRHEQFAGFSDLTPLIITDIAQPPIAADILLGREVVQSAQVVKQADVLMLHHLVPWEVERGSLAQDLRHYAPRTAHGSSLSPAVHAAAWARAGRPDLALDLLRIALRLDLDDATGTTAGGLHVAAMGGVWQAITWGFLGLRADVATLAIDPILPSSWDAVEATVRFRGARVVVRVTHPHVDVRCDRPTPVTVQGGGPVTVGPDGRRLPLARRAPE